MGLNERFIRPESGIDRRLAIQAGSDLYDGSVRARLNALAQQF